jgi:hypothetical protein
VKKINDAWLSGLSGDEREKMKQEVLANENLLDKLSKILYNIQEKKQETVLGDYDTPSWSHKQAHQNGEAAALRKVIEIITIREREDPPTHR